MWRSLIVPFAMLATVMGCTAPCGVRFNPELIPYVVSEPKPDDLDETVRVDIRAHCAWRL